MKNSLIDPEEELPLDEDLADDEYGSLTEAELDDEEFEDDDKDEDDDE